MKEINRLALGVFISTIVFTLLLAVVFVWEVVATSGQSCGFLKVYLDVNGETICMSYMRDLLVGIIACIIYLNVSILPFYIFVIYLNFRRKKNNKRIENSEIIYQRDLPNYNAAIAAYLVDGVIDVERDYNALLIELMERGIIIKENNEYVVKDLNKCLLLHTETEKYVASNLNKKVNKRAFKKAVLQDVKNLNLITMGDIPVFGVILVLLFFNQFYLIVLVIVYFKTALLQELIYKLTPEGGKEKDKMLKLKAFLHDFSKIENVEKLEHNIWERYLPFAIALDENDNFLKKNESEGI